MKVFGDEFEKLDCGKNISAGSSLFKLDPVFDPERTVIRVGGRSAFAEIAFEAKHQAC